MSWLVRPFVWVPWVRELGRHLVFRLDKIQVERGAELGMVPPELRLSLELRRHPFFLAEWVLRQRMVGIGMSRSGAQHGKTQL